MHLSNEFAVSATFDEVWTALIDLERVTPCLPGAKLTGTDADGYTGEMKVKLGSILSTYKGKVRLERSDRDAGIVVIRAQGKDARGQGTAEAVITSTAVADGDRTKLIVATDMQVSGPAAQFGRGIMERVSARLMGQFAQRLSDDVATRGATPATEPAPGDPKEPGGGTERPSTARASTSTAHDADDVLDVGKLAGAELGRKPLIIAGIAALVLAFLLGRCSAR